MIFYSTVSIVIGIMFFGVGLFYLINKDKMTKQFSEKRITNINFYVKFSGYDMSITGILLLIAGILSFIIDKDLLFAIIFTVLIITFFITDYVCQKKLVKKN